MSVVYTSITGGPAYAAINSKNIQFAGDSNVATELVREAVTAALYGDIDDTISDMIVKASGTPLYYDTAQIATMFPYIVSTNAWYGSGGGNTRGALYPTSSALTCAWNSDNGDVVTLASAIIGKMPDITLSVKGTALGAMEIWGVLPWGTDATTANAYYTLATGQSYSNPAVPGTAVLGRQEFTAAWSGITGFTSFQAQDAWTISHELKLQPVVIQGRTRGFKWDSYRCMAKCKPLGPTMAQISAALGAQGVSNSAGGSRLSTNAANLVITGASSMTVTIGGAAMVSAGYVFGGVPLRPGEIGWVSTLNTNNGGTPSQPALTLA